MTKLVLVCAVCIRNNEEKFRQARLENIQHEAVENAKLAVTIVKGFAVCKEHIHIISGCFSFY